MADLRAALFKTLEHEGGYVNHPSDPGGETAYGITKKTAVAAGYIGNMKDLTVDKACEIYKQLYWDKIKGDDINFQCVASELFDTAVNCGIKRAVTFLQKAYNKLVKGSPLTEDGLIGPKTIAAVNSYHKPQRLEKAMNAEQCRYYSELVEKNEKYEDFYFGWLDKRVAI